MTQNPNQKAIIIAEIKSFIFIAFMALLIRTLLVEPFFIPSSSMKDTLLIGDYVFSTKYDYGYSKYSTLFINPDFIHGRILARNPERGDIIIFRPPHDMNVRYIKRLIGMPGDKIQMIDNVAYINGSAVKREYIGAYEDDAGKYKKYLETLPNGVSYHTLQLSDYGALPSEYGNTGEFHVPDGHYFFIGDNRDQSGDSRAQLGYVPFENFIAKAQFVFFSTEKLLWLDSSSVIDQVSQVYHWLASIRWGRIFKNVYNITD